MNAEQAGYDTSVVPAHVYKDACWHIFAGRLPKDQRVMDEELSDRVEFLLTNSGLRAKQEAAP